MENLKTLPAPETRPAFTAAAITTPQGETFPAVYHLFAGAVVVEITTPAGQRAEITVDEKSPYYYAAISAAREAERAAAEAEAAAKEAQRAARKAARAADPDKQAHGPIPEKTWAGTVIRGCGWRIEFSVTYDKTRIIFDSVPTEEAREIVKAAGFYWSPTLKSWNKGLNWKAYRAALAVQEKLSALPLLPCKVKRRAA